MVMSRNTMICLLGSFCLLAFAQSFPTGSLEEALSKTAHPGAGLLKGKLYDWQDSNVALVGSDLDKQVKKESAAQEPAWKTVGQKVGLQIWRIVNFEVVPVAKESYGKFFDGDSYIVLNTHQDPSSEALLYDVFFWIGKHSSQDEFGTAAYKTAELDTYVNGAARQHRELQDYETPLFTAMFKAVEVMNGGAKSGFTHVSPKEFTPRLLQFHGDRFGVMVEEVARVQDSLDTSDVFIMDLGLELIQWNGVHSNKDERMRAHKFMGEIASERSGKCKTQVVEEGMEDAVMRRFLNIDVTEEKTRSMSHNFLFY